MTRMRSQAPGWPRLFAATLVIVVATCIVHEAGHALVAKLLGYDVIVTANTVTLAEGDYRSAGDRMAVDLAGPLATLLIAAAAWFRGMRGRSILAASVVFAALMMRLVAAGVSFGNPNDEARISLALGLGFWTVFAVVIALLAAMFVTLYARLGLGWRWLLVSYLAASLGFAGIVFGARILPPIAL